MRIFLIAGEASGDLHASHLMKALKARCPEAEFRGYGGDLMRNAGGELLCHYRELAYMGFVQVALHLRTILRGMKRCEEEIAAWKPDALILVDYPGFNLRMAKFAKRHALCPVFYYISPKIWAWKERRIKDIRANVDELFSILPFEVDFFERKHHYPIHYVGNPSVDEVARFQSENGAPQPDGHTIALLPGSRRQEIKDNLSRMLRAVEQLADYRLVIAQAPSVEAAFYERILSETLTDRSRVTLVEGQTYHILSRATLALVTSGTATLETALFRVPQVVCYYMRGGRIVNKLQPHFLKVPFISLVNLIAGREVVPELVAGDMNVNTLSEHINQLLPAAAPARLAQLQGYDEMAKKLGSPGAPERAAKGMLDYLKKLQTRPS